jgi:hypothetical protein
MSPIIFVCNKESHVFVQLAGEILGATFNHLDQYLMKVPSDRTSVWAMAPEEFGRYRLTASVAYISISLMCIEETHEYMSDNSTHYEYNFTRRNFVREDFVRFLSFITGQSDHLNRICGKKRSYYIGMTFPKVNVALPNLSIVSVGADALELRVDLLKNQDLEYQDNWTPPGLDFVATQLMALRNRTELPIIFTIRSEDSGGW